MHYIVDILSLYTILLIVTLSLLKRSVKVCNSIPGLKTPIGILS